MKIQYLEMFSVLSILQIVKKTDVLLFSNLASRWRDASSGHHVDYDQKPDVFR